MLPRADLTGTRPVVLIEASRPSTAVGDARQESFNRLNQLALGAEFKAQVMSRLADGNFLVRIADANASMALPQGTKAGDLLDLTLMATQPRPTFLLGKPDSSATTSLSTAGRLIGSMLQAAQEDGVPTALLGKAPLVGSPGASAQQVASALQNTLAFSGLFYESHLAQWANGGRKLADLMREPQARLAHAAMNDATPRTTENTNDLARMMTNVREWVGGERSLTDLLRTSQDGADAVARPDTANNEALRLMSLQLNALEQRRVLWQGELWPGQPLEWEVAEDAPGDGNGDDEAARSWQSTVRFTLPTLGEVAATIRLTGEHVQVQVSTASEATAAALQAHRDKLADALDAAGSTLDSLMVKQDGAR
jgi:hypothetical protein